jgi:hypothetical protein
LSNQKFNSNLFQILDDWSVFNPTQSINNGLDTNDVDYNFTDVYLGFRYRVKTGKFTITPGFSVHSYGNKNTQSGETFEDNFLRILPEFETRIQFKKSENLTFRYTMSNAFTDVTSLAEGLVLNNYSSYQSGNPELQNSLSHNLNLSYFSFNLFNYTNVFAIVNYSKNIDQIRNRTAFDNVIRRSTFFNSNFADESLTAFGRVQRTFRKIRASLRVNYNYSKINQFVQDNRSVNESFTQRYTPEISTNFKEAPNVRFSSAYSITVNDNGESSTKFVRNSPSIEFDAYIWKSLTFKTDFTYTNQDDGSDSQSFQTWDASLAYRKDQDAKWEYEVRASNLLDIDSQINNGASTISVFSNETFIQPRFVTLRVIYTL